MGICAGQRPRFLIRANDQNIYILEKNLTLDKWTEPQIKILFSKFNKFKNSFGLQKKGFIQLFNGLGDYPVAFVNRTFESFDKNGIDRNGNGSISFRNFCIILADIILCERNEKARYIFHLFDLDNDGWLKESEFEFMFRSLENFLRPFSIIPAENSSLQKQKLGTPPINLDDFTYWALGDLDIEKILKPFQIIPDAESEKEIVLTLLATDLEPGSSVYLLSADWFRVWRLYTNCDQKNKDNSNKIFEGSKMQNNSRPSEIDNSSLLECESKLVIKLRSHMNIDYIPVNKTLWETLISWYGGGPAIKREVYNEAGKPTIELLPSIWTIIPISITGFVLHDQKKNALLRKTNKFKKLLKQASRIFKVQQEHSRLWIYYNKKWNILKLENELDDHSAFDSKEVLIETMILDKNGISYWPREILKNDEFRAGNKIQVYLGNDECVEGIIINTIEESLTLKLLNRLDTIILNNVMIPKKSLLMPLRSLTPGGIGLLNLGNTCFMNSIIQALCHTPLLKCFLSKYALAYISKTNKILKKEAVSLELSLLIRDMWNGKHSKLNPTKLYRTITQYYTMFEGNQQHDCHEFLGLILDNMHESFIRGENSPEKPGFMIENPMNKDDEIKLADSQWNLFLGSQGSPVTDLLGGQTRNTLQCNHCGHRCIIFEIFTNLSLPLPASMMISIYVTVVLNKQPLTKLAVLISKYAKIDELLDKISGIIAVDKNSIYLCEIVNQTNLTPLHINPQDMLAKLGIMAKHELYCYEITSSIQELEKLGKKVLTPLIDVWGNFQVKDQVDVKVLNKWTTGRIKDLRHKDGKLEYFIDFDSSKYASNWVDMGSLGEFRFHTRPNNPQSLNLLIYNTQFLDGKRSFIGIPLLLSIGNWYNLSDLHEISTKALNKFINRGSEIFSKSTPKTDFFNLVIVDRETLLCGLCRRCSGCSLRLSKSSVKGLNDHSRQITLAADWNPTYFSEEAKYHESVVEIKSKEEDIYKPIDVSTCLDAFTKEEKLDAKCEKCGTNSLSMQMEIWRIPDILILSFKRFSYQDGSIDKIDNDVTFPIKDFNISRWIRSISEYTSSSIHSEYDLYAVVSHTGNIVSGHYVSICKNHTKDQTWLLFDDDHVLEISPEFQDELISKNAYLLFYRRKRFSSSNIINLKYLSG